MNPENEIKGPENSIDIFEGNNSQPIGGDITAGSSVDISASLSEDLDADIEIVDGDDTQSVDDFIKELEAKEKDLHIDAGLQIEISDGDFDFAIVPDFVQEELQSATPKPVAVVAPSPGTKTRVYELEQEIESLRQKLTTLRLERDDIQKKSDVRVKDFENYKYRMDRERRGASINQIANLATQMLPVLDNLDRAIDSISSVSEKKRNEFKQFFDGVALVNQQLTEIFADMGVEPILTIGETFDPHFHEAVSTEETTELPTNTICGEILRGYRLGNMVIRHSMVRVAMPPLPTKGKNKPDVKDGSAPEPVSEPLPDNPPLDAE